MRLGKAPKGLLEEMVQRLELRREGDTRPAIVLILGFKPESEMTRANLGRSLWKWLQRRRGRCLEDRAEIEPIALLVAS